MLGVPTAPTVYVGPKALFGSFLSHPKVKELLSDRVKAQHEPTVVRLIEAKILQLFQKEKLSHTLTKEITQQYHQELLGSFVRISSGYENIIGDSNLIESLAEYSSKLLEQGLAVSRDSGMPLLSSIAGAFIQTQLQASSSGIAYSKNTTQPNKNTIVVSAQIGVVPAQSDSVAQDRYEIHRSSLKEIAAKIGTKTICFGRTQDSFEKKKIPSKQQNGRVVTKKQTEQLAKFTISISQKVFRPIAMRWEIDKNNLFVTDVSEIVPQQTSAPEDRVASITIITPNNDAWQILDRRWKSQPESTAAILADFLQRTHLAPATNIRIPNVTNLQELEAARTSLLAATSTTNTWQFWPEISSLGILFELKNYSALDFFDGIMLDIPGLLQSLYVTPTWSDTEYDLLFSLIEQQVPNHMLHGLILHELPSNTLQHLDSVVYKYIHAPESLEQILRSLVSDLEAKRWKALP